MYLASNSPRFMVHSTVVS